jgi:D-lactate dehydrogenase
MKVTVFSAKQFEIPYIEKANHGKFELLFTEKRLSEETIDLAKGSTAVSIFVNDDASREVIEKLGRQGVKYIANRAAGYDHINLTTADKLNISVGYVPEYSPYAIAEHAIALILALNRKVIQAHQKISLNNYSLDNLIGFDLNNKTVGIIGLGKIGGIVAKILNGFGCKLLGYDIYPNQEYVEKYDLRYVTLDEIYQHSDIISLHTPLTSSTKYMINEKTIPSMKKGVMIINTARGGLINTLEAINGIKTGQIGYLGLDVYEKEKGLFFYDHSGDLLSDDTFSRLLTFPNVLVTGHQAFLTENALTNIAEATIYNLKCFEEGSVSKYSLHSKKIVI